MNKPIIALTPLFDIETGTYKMQTAYTHSIINAGGIPIILPITDDADSLKHLIDRCNGFLLTGGQDILPELYNHKKLDCCGVICPERDLFEKTFVPMAIESNKPILAICRGMQMLNIALGGTLYQDIPSQIKSNLQHRMPQPCDKFIHSVNITENTPLYDIFGCKSAMVNSYHHQCVDKLGNGLEVMARAEDSVIEGIYMPQKKFVLGVQWHPERTSVNDPHSAMLFKRLVKSSMC